MTDPSHSLLYLIGEPGVGKSTTMQELTAGLDRWYSARPLHHERLARGPRETLAVELGRTREGFPGTDTLALNANPRAIEFVYSRPAPIVLAEGDRLANMRFLKGAAVAGYLVHVAYLTASDPAVPAARRAGRGSQQNEAWLRGRQTKVRNLAAAARQAGMEVLSVDTAARTPAQVANVLRGAWPFLDAIPRVGGVPA